MKLPNGLSVYRARVRPFVIDSALRFSAIDLNLGFGRRTLGGPRKSKMYPLYLNSFPVVLPYPRSGGEKALG